METKSSCHGADACSQTTHTSLTHCLPETSADDLCKQFGPRSGPTKRRARSVSKLFDNLIVFLKEFFEKVDFEKKSADDKILQNYPVGKGVMIGLMVKAPINQFLYRVASSHYVV